MALFFLLLGGEARAQIVITEIMYHPDSIPGLSWEWIEIYNAGMAEVDLDGWVVDDINGISLSASNVSPAVVQPGTRAVLYNADDLIEADFEAAWGVDEGLVAVTDWDVMSLNDSGDTVSLWDSFASYVGDHEIHANAVATVAYDDDGTIWPLDDGAASIYLLDPLADPDDGANWALSTDGVDGAYTSTAAGGNLGMDVGSPLPEPGVATGLTYAILGLALVSGRRRRQARF